MIVNHKPFLVPLSTSILRSNLSVLSSSRVLKGVLYLSNYQETTKQTKMSLGEYTPRSPEEKHIYDFLWHHVSPNGEAIAGAAAVTFFRESRVDGGFLKQIWSLSTPVATMNREQFNSALRYLTMVQNGEFPISKERLTKTANEALGMPYFPSITIPPYQKPVVPVPVPVPAANLSVGGAVAFPPGTASSSSMVMTGASVGPYAITPIEHFKYHQVRLHHHPCCAHICTVDLHSFLLRS